MCHAQHITYVVLHRSIIRVQSIKYSVRIRVDEIYSVLYVDAAAVVRKEGVLQHLRVNVADSVMAATAATAAAAAVWLYDMRDKELGLTAGFVVGADLAV